MKKFSQLAFPYIVWAILMLVFPMVLIALYSVTDQGNSILSFTFTLEHYAKFFTDPDFLLILWRSIVIAVKTTVICLLLGYPIAYYIARSEQKKQNALILVITIPMWINMLVRTYAWIGLLSDGGLIQRILHMVGLGKGSLLYTEGAVLLGMVYNFLPFMILQIQTSLSKMDNSLLEASADLGASPAQTFKRVTLPLSVPGIINGITLDIPEAVPARGGKWYYDGFPSCHFLLRYPEASGRRTVHAYRKPDRVPVYLSWRLEFRKCHFHDHGGHYDGTYDGCP